MSIGFPLPLNEQWSPGPSLRIIESSVTITKGTNIEAKGSSGIMRSHPTYLVSFDFNQSNQLDQLDQQLPINHHESQHRFECFVKLNQCLLRNSNLTIKSTFPPRLIASKFGLSLRTIEFRADLLQLWLKELISYKNQWSEEVLNEFNALFKDDDDHHHTSSSITVSTIHDDMNDTNEMIEIKSNKSIFFNNGDDKIHDNNFMISYDTLKIDQKIESFGKGHIFRGMMGRKRKVIIKAIFIKGETFTSLNPEKELLILSKLKHKNIPNFWGVSYHFSSMYLVSELVESSLLSTVTREDFNVHTMAMFGTQLLSVVAYLHKCPLIHRDLNPQSVLVSSRNQIKISSFGSSQLEDTSIEQQEIFLSTLYTKQVISKLYLPPESSSLQSSNTSMSIELSSSELDKISPLNMPNLILPSWDIYSCGQLLLFMFYKQHRVHDETMRTVINDSIHQIEKPSMNLSSFDKNEGGGRVGGGGGRGGSSSSMMPVELVLLISKMRHKDKHQRPSIEYCETTFNEKIVSILDQFDNNGATPSSSSSSSSSSIERPVGIVDDFSEGIGMNQDLLAQLPTTMPEVKTSILPRCEFQDLLNSILPPQSSNVPSSSPSSTTTGLIGVGGSGTTTLASSVISHLGVRSEFEIIVWVSVGKKSCMFTKLNSILHQVCGDTLPEADLTLSCELVKTACLNRSILLVLDDLCDSQSFSLLNVLDYDSKVIHINSTTTNDAIHTNTNLVGNSDKKNSFDSVDSSIYYAQSHLLFISEFKGLIHSANEVELGALTLSEAQNLLEVTVLPNRHMPSSKTTQEDISKTIDIELLELVKGSCIGVSLVAGYINALGVASELMASWVAFENQATVSDPLNSLIAAIALKLDQDTTTVIHFFAVFPLAARVPMEVLDILAPLIFGDKSVGKLDDELDVFHLRQRFGIGYEVAVALLPEFSEYRNRLAQSISKLLKFNLLSEHCYLSKQECKLRKDNAELSSPTYIEMHCIIRDYVISKHAKQELILLQKRVIGVICDYRPMYGFPLHGTALFQKKANLRYVYEYTHALTSGDFILLFGQESSPPLYEFIQYVVTYLSHHIIGSIELEEMIPKMNQHLKNQEQEDLKDKEILTQKKQLHYHNTVMDHSKSGNDQIFYVSKPAPGFPLASLFAHRDRLIANSAAKSIFAFIKQQQEEANEMKNQTQVNSYETKLCIYKGAIVDDEDEEVTLVDLLISKLQVLAEQYSLAYAALAAFAIGVYGDFNSFYLNSLDQSNLMFMAQDFIMKHNKKLELLVEPQLKGQTIKGNGSGETSYIEGPFLVEMNILSKSIVIEPISNRGRRAQGRCITLSRFMDAFNKTRFDTKYGEHLSWWWQGLCAMFRSSIGFITNQTFKEESDIMHKKKDISQSSIPMMTSPSEHCSELDLTSNSISYASHLSTSQLIEMNLLPFIPSPRFFNQSLHSESSPYFNIPRADVELEETSFAKGGGGQIFKGKYSGLVIAAKEIFPTTTTTVVERGKEGTAEKGMVLEDREEFDKEVNMLTKLSHPNVTTLFGVCEDVKAKDLYIIMEYCIGGDLAHYINQQEFDTFQFLQTSQEVLAGIEYLHQKGVAHRDLKPANVLIDSMGHMKIADFGLARAKRNTDTLAIGVGTPPYMAPELLDENSDELLLDLFATDVYAIGVILWQLWFRSDPWMGQSVYKIFKQVRKGKRPTLKNSSSSSSSSSSFDGTTKTSEVIITTPNGNHILFHRCNICESCLLIKTLWKKCWVQNPTERPTVTSVLQSINYEITTSIKSNHYYVDNFKNNLLKDTHSFLERTSEDRQELYHTARGEDLNDYIHLSKTTLLEEEEEEKEEDDLDDNDMIGGSGHSEGMNEVKKLPIITDETNGRHSSTFYTAMSDPNQPETSHLNKDSNSNDITQHTAKLSSNETSEESSQNSTMVLHDKLIKMSLGFGSVLKGLECLAHSQILLPLNVQCAISIGYHSILNLISTMHLLSNLGHISVFSFDIRWSPTSLLLIQHLEISSSQSTATNSDKNDNSVKALFSKSNSILDGSNILQNSTNEIDPTDTKHEEEQEDDDDDDDGIVVDCCTIAERRQACAEALQIIRVYEYSTHHSKCKSTLTMIDYWLSGAWLVPMVLHYGEVCCLSIYLSQALPVFRSHNSTSKTISSELSYCLRSAVPLLRSLHWNSSACDLLSACGFTSPYEIRNNKNKLHIFNQRFEQISQSLEHHTTNPKKINSNQKNRVRGIALISKLLVFLCFDIPEYYSNNKIGENSTKQQEKTNKYNEEEEEEENDIKNREWDMILKEYLNISKEDLFEEENHHNSIDSILGLYDCICLGGLVFEKLGRYKEAYEIALKGSLNCLRATSRCQCDLILARLYTQAYKDPTNSAYFFLKNSLFFQEDMKKEENEKELTKNKNKQDFQLFFQNSENYFRAALIEARRSRLPMYEIIVAKEYESSHPRYHTSEYNSKIDTTFDGVENNSAEDEVVHRYDIRVNEMVESALRRMGREWEDVADAF